MRTKWVAVAIVASLACWRGATDARAELGSDVLKKVEEQARIRQETFEVDAGIRIRSIKCQRFGSGRLCIGGYVNGIIFNSLTEMDKLRQMQLVISRTTVKSQKDIGRALNAFLISVPFVKSQKQLDILAIAGGACALASDESKMNIGPLTFEQTGTGCVISFDVDAPGQF